MYVTINGSVVSDPVLIYFDEIHLDPLTTSRDYSVEVPGDIGAVVCRSNSSSRVGWHLTTGANVTDSGSSHSSHDFKQIRTTGDTIPSLSRLSRNREGINRADSLINGLWHCRLNGNTRGQISVGIYSRGQGECTSSVQ